MGLGMVIAGGLQGAGKGLAETGAADLDYQRSVALEELRSRRQREHTAQTYDLADRNDGRAAARDDFYGARSDVRRGQIQQQRDLLQGDIDAAADARDFQQQMTLERFKQSHDFAIEDHKAVIDQIADERKAGREIKDIVQHRNGQYFGITATGESIALKGAKGYLIAKPDEDEAGIGSIRDRRRAQPPPSAQPQREPTAQAPKAQSAKTYTQAEAQATAQARGIPVEEVHRVMRASGYKLTTG